MGDSAVKPSDGLGVRVPPSDDGPVLELERRNFRELGDRPTQIRFSVAAWCAVGLQWPQETAHVCSNN
ncbi:hypothetical protein RAS1_26590 [Phycisphaerae bacterium RAS1]|nr:hypothetical protein RAS1_26590 [Phycisphaerae bacterium RAS1]